jgi:putative ribosome biogenesis GTPase RsgA
VYTGVGKSALTNFLADEKDGFAVSDASFWGKQLTTSKVFKLLGREKNI